MTRSESLMSKPMPVGEPLSKALTISVMQQMKSQGQKIVVLTAYDFTFARLFSSSGAHLLLVGDSLGMVVQGGEDTLSVTVEDMEYHTRAVRRGAGHCHVVADMPFMSYQTCVEDAIRNAGRLLQAGAHSVKLEGGSSLAPTVRTLVTAGIPVMAHVGLMPQSVRAMGGYRVQGRDQASAERILNDALSLEEAGAYAVLIEGVPAELAARITARLQVPTIGIGAGADCDGQVLVGYDMLGLGLEKAPKFVKDFGSLGDKVRQATKDYALQVTEGSYPGVEHSYTGERAPYGDSES